MFTLGTLIVSTDRSGDVGLFGRMLRTWLDRNGLHDRLYDRLYNKISTATAFTAIPPLQPRTLPCAHLPAPIAFTAYFCSGLVRFSVMTCR